MKNFFNRLFKKTQSANVNETGETSIRTNSSPITPGRDGFRPFSEPLLKPKPPIDGPVYDVYEKVFKPKTIERVSLTEPLRRKTEWFDEKTQVFAPNNQSVDDLLETLFPSPTDPIMELLPKDANKEDYLPAIKLAIKFTTAQRNAKKKCQAWLESVKQRLYQARSGKLQSADFWGSENLASDYWKWEGARKFTTPDGLFDIAAMNNFLSQETSQEIIDWNYFNDMRDERQKRAELLESRYLALQSILNDYESFGLLHYRPYLHAMSYPGEKWASKVLEVIASWAQHYDALSRGYGEGYLASWEGHICRRYANSHRQLQGLSSCLINGLPIFPSLGGKYASGDAYFDAVCDALKSAVDHLEVVLNAFLEKTNHEKTDANVVEKFLNNAEAQLSKGVRIYSDYKSPGHLLNPENVLGIPRHLITEQMSVERAFEIYNAYIVSSEKLLQELTAFPGEIPR